MEIVLVRLWYFTIFQQYFNYIVAFDAGTFCKYKTKQAEKDEPNIVYIRSEHHNMELNRYKYNDMLCCITLFPYLDDFY